MKFDHILCPVDFSPPSDAAVTYASQFASRHNSTLHLIYVYELVFVGSHTVGMSTYPLPADFDLVSDRLKAVLPTCEGVAEVRHDLILGFPGSSIVGYAQANIIDLIVMGTHGRRGAGRVLMGSVAETVVRRAPCPVLTVHPPADLAAKG